MARLGAGGMGEVFLGRSASGRLVAVKVVRAELSDDPDFRGRFRREVDASRRVSAFHTAAVVAADADATPAWMVTEYIPGPSLEEAVRRHGPFPAHALRVIGAGLAEALEAIHSAGLIHRDLKPSNILLAEDGPRVIDFGIARALEGSTVTRTGFMVGSVGFLSPEQLLGETVTAAADVFALGAVLCSAAGLAPFGGGSAQAMLYRVVHTQPDLADLPDELRDTVAACLAKDPAQRPQPMELLHALAAEPSGEWLSPVILASIGERREHAQHLARRTGSGLGAGAFVESPADSPSDFAADSTADSAVDSTVGSTVGPTYGTDAVPAPSPPDADGSLAPASGHSSTDTTAPDPPPGSATPAWAAGVTGIAKRPDATPPRREPPSLPSVPPAPPAPPPGTPAGSPPAGQASSGPGIAAVPSFPAASPPHHTPPGPWPSVYTPHTAADAPPAGTRLDRLPGGRRVWLTAVVVTALAVLAGAGVLVSRLVGDDKSSGATRTSTSTGPSSDGIPPPSRGGTVTVSINADSSTLDPFTARYQAFGDGQRMSALYDPLVVFDPDTGKVTPHLAKSLTSTPDGFTWSLELRPGVRFTDGTPLDADAVQFNWERHADPAVRSAHSNAVRGATMRVVTPTRLDITLPVPDLTFDHLVADELAYIASPTAVRADPAGFGRHPVGAGPFKLESWTPGEKQVFVRNPDYWQGPDKPYLDSLVFTVNAEQPVAPVIGGNADVNFQSADRDLQQARSADLELVPTVNAGGVMLGFNSAVAPFDDPRARKAVALALDAAALARDSGSGAVPTRSVVPPRSPLLAGNPPAQPGPDRTAAQALFDQLAASGKPLSFTVLCGPGEERAMEALKAQLSAYRNVTMRYDVADAARFADTVGKRRFQALWGYEAGADPDTWLFAVTRGGYSGNYLGYRNPTVDKGWDAVRAATTPEAKAAAYTTILQALNDDPPWWLYAQISVFAVQREGALTGLDGAYADGILRWDRVGKS
jgi:ABC-type transport system substrate-binding protein/serine/threonine protein kinase